MTLEEAKELIPTYVTTKDIQELLGVGRRLAEKIYRELKEENKNKPIPNSKKIPLDWVLKKYGIQKRGN